MSSDQIGFALGRIATLLRAQAWQQAEPLGVNPTQAAILSRLLARGALRPGALAADLGISQPTVTDAVAALLRKGLVQRQRDPADRRAVLLRLTTAGQSVAQATAPPPDVLTAALDSLPASDRAAMQRGLVGLIRALQQARAIPVQRICISCTHFRPHAHDDAEQPHHCALVDAAFGDAALRIDCGEHDSAAEQDQARLWARFRAAA